MRTATLLLALAACSPIDDELDDGELDEVTGDLDTAVLGPAATRLFYGTTVQSQTLIYYRIAPPNPNGKKAFLTFAIHGFEDAWAQDGRALYSIAHKAIDYYGNNPAQLKGWTLYIVPSANPDGMRYGINNLREGSGAYGRCTSLGKDINRHVSSGTSLEQRRLKALFDDVKPTIAIDFHGWFNTYYGNTRIGGFFQSAFNASYTGKPAKYCYVASTGVMDCGSLLGGVFHGSPTIATDLFAEWATRVRGVPAALVEYPAPDFNLNGVYDSVFDDALGYRRITKSTGNLLWDRTRVGLDNLLADF